MPAPTKDQLARLTKVLFCAKGIMLPQDWSNPGIQYPDAFDPAELAVAPNPPNTLFLQATLNKLHVDTAGEIGKKFEEYIDGITDAICGAIDKWMKMSMFTVAIINTAVGIVPPGSLVGPPLAPLIIAKGPKNTPKETQYTNAIANALGTNWQGWQAGLTGMLTYPAFAAFAGPVAPPMSNVPVPLITFGSAGEALLSPNALKGLMMAFLGDPTAQHAMDLFDAVSNAFNIVFQIFKMSTMVQNVLGMGPIPTFAPPVVPVGPVLGGFLIPMPGVLS